MLVACAAPRVINSPDPQQIASSVKAHDKVHVVTYDGKVFDFQVTAVRADELSGRDHDKTYQVAFAQIQELQVTGGGLRRYSTLQKIGLGIAAALHAALVVAFLVFSLR
jgi:hypothetical protein